MDADLAAKVGALLSDPEAVAKISQIASSLGKPNAEHAFHEPARQTSSEPDPRMALLSGLKAVMRDDKKQKVDTLIKALAVISTLDRFNRPGGN